MDELIASAAGILDTGVEIGDLGAEGAVASDSPTMILTCPECATSYFADDSSIGAGRTVRCAACGATWRAEPDRQPEEPATVAEPATIEDDPFASTAPAADSELFERPISPPIDDDSILAVPIHDRKTRVRREGAAQGMVWAALGGAFALLLVTALLFRFDIVQLWPKTASVYAGIGLPVNGIGLEIEKVHGRQSLLDGRPALVVTGVLHNVRRETIIAPPISISLLDKSGRKVLVKTIQADDPVVPPGQTRDFKLSLLNPPSGASSLDVTLVLGKRAPTASSPSAATPASGH